MLIEINVGRLLFLQFLQEILLLTPLCSFMITQNMIMKGKVTPLLYNIYKFITALLLCLLLIIFVSVFFPKLFYNHTECGIEVYSLHIYIFSIGILVIGFIIYMGDQFLIHYLNNSIDKKFGFLQKKRSIVS